MDIKELLELRGLNTRAKIKMVRHQDQRWDVNKLYRDGHLDAYQSYQSRPVLECDYIVSFIGLEKNKAKFIGVYRVKGRRAADEVVFSNASSLNQEFAVGADYYYDTEQCPGFEDLIGRLVIDWGKSARSWHQWLAEKEVTEVLPRGHVKDFPGFLDVALDYDELVEIIDKPEGNRKWHTALSSVAGVYLIVDGQTGQQYVGSAYGRGGILGRWAEYARTGHGGNKKLIELLESNPGYARNFRFTILRTLDKSLTDREVLEYEKRYKSKLGSRAFGLNTL